MNVHFICRGNVLRSLIAETYLKSLNLKNTQTISSGTDVRWEDQTERNYFDRTLDLLDKHSIKSYAKHLPDQLTQKRMNQAHDIVILMNQRVATEAVKIVDLPENAIIWEIVDIGEQHRTTMTGIATYEEEIYQEIKSKVDDLVQSALTFK